MAYNSKWKISKEQQDAFIDSLTKELMALRLKYSKNKSPYLRVIYA